jgi:trehalose 6-phosphate phosphatase
LVDVAARAALFVDFDGSLAPIVDDPARAQPLPRSVEALSVLARRLARVAVVTGRPVGFVRRHVPDPAVAIAGQYGLERDVWGQVEADPRAAAFEGVVAAAAAAAQARWPALSVERKGTIALTVHWRRAPNQAPPERDLEAFAAEHGLWHVRARMACELRPPIPVDKGTALAEFLHDEITAAAFAGDDYGDLAAFVRLRQWADAEPSRRMALRVAVASDETPAELVELADLVLEGPAALADHLTRLAEALG